MDFMEGQTTDQQLDWLVATLQAIHDGVLVIDKNEVVRMINPEYTKITGVAPENIVGKRLRDVRPKALLVETLKDRKERVGIYRKEGVTEYVVDMAPIILNGETVGAVSICKGLTEVHKLSQELEKNQKKLNQLKNKIGSLYQAKYTFDQIIGSDKGLKEVIHIGRRAADSDLSVLIIGESGTGKELFAQSIHNESPRANKPFIPVNCAAIPSSIIESELFGYDEGSFTTAKKGGKVGLFEIANSGTIFLDEIGELSYELQAKLLRVLQEQTIRRVGETREKHIDVRVIAATNRNLQQMIEKRLFREDLFYRLNVLNIQIPALHKRKEDIPDIIHYILGISNRNLSKADGASYYTISEEALYLLQNHEWTGNVRELKNTIEYAVCMTDGREILPKHLPNAIVNKKGNSNQLNNHRNRALREITAEVERKCILESLDNYGYEVEGKKKVAKELGVSLATLYNKMKKLKIE
ncbi:sigma-54 interaction domain-containing protein [Metabacillus herbersteinensis]